MLHRLRQILPRVRRDLVGLSMAASVTFAPRAAAANLHPLTPIGPTGPVGPLGPALPNPSTAPAAAPAATQPAAASEPPAAAKQKSSGLLLLGDSMMKVGVGPELKMAFGPRFGEPVTIHAKSATGLARPDAYDWPDEVRKLLASWHYARAVVMLGTNDCQTMTIDGKQLHFGTDDWRVAYQQRLKDFLVQLCGGVDEVLWVGLPPMRNAKFSARITSLNAVLETEVKASTCGKWVAAPAALADAKGRFRSHAKVGKRYARVRAADGIHMTPLAGQAVAGAVLATWPR